MNNNNNNNNKVFVNITSGLFQFIISATLTSIGVSLAINRLGMEQYGVFATLGILGSLSSFTNLGLSATLSKFVGEQGCNNESFYDLVTSIILLSFTVIPSMILLIYFKFEVMSFLSIPQERQRELSILYVSYLVSNAILMYGQIFSAVLEARLKLYVINLSQVINNLICWGGIITVILLGFKTVTLFYIPILLSSFFWLLIIIYFALKEFDNVLVDKYNYNKKFSYHKTKQLNYSLKIFTAGMVGFFYEPLTKVLAARFFGVQSVAFFDIALKVKGYVVGLGSRFISPIFGIIANENNINLNIKNVCRYTSLIFLSLIIFTIPFYFIVPFGIKYWIGNNVLEISLYVRVVCISYLISNLAMPAYYYFMLKGFPSIILFENILKITLNVLFLLVLKDFWGDKSLIVSICISFIISNLALLGYFKFKFKQVTIKNFLFDWSHIVKF